MPPPRAKPSFAVIAAGLGAALAGLLLAGTLMAQECPLSAPLTLKDLQSGVVGETGTVWTIAPDCSFTVARQVGRKVMEPHKSGRLTAAQQQELGQMMDRMPQVEAAPRPAAPPPVNARRLTLTYGSREAALTLPPGGADIAGQRAPQGDSRASHLLEAAEMVKKMLGN
jgi:hypothetical protein